MFNARTSGFVPPNTGGYFGTATVREMAKDDSNFVGQYQMQGCWPIDVGQVMHDWGDNDRIAEFTVTFAYQWWTSIAVPI
jgi:hypothetical protein